MREPQEAPSKETDNRPLQAQGHEKHDLGGKAAGPAFRPISKGRAEKLKKSSGVRGEESLCCITGEKNSRVTLKKRALYRSLLIINFKGSPRSQEMDASFSILEQRLH